MAGISGFSHEVLQCVYYTGCVTPPVTSFSLHVYRGPDTSSADRNHTSTYVSTGTTSFRQFMDGRQNDASVTASFFPFSFGMFSTEELPTLPAGRAGHFVALVCLAGLLCSFGKPILPTHSPVPPKAISISTVAPETSCP